MPVTVRLTQIDGKLPNLALMKLAHYHRAIGDEVYFTRHVERGLLEGAYTKVYGSAIFSYSADRVRAFHEQFPDAIVGGTWNPAARLSVEEVLGTDSYEHYDYSIYPDFDASIGFTQRGCRLKCGFCVVPKKEGKVHGVNSIDMIWRGDPWPRHLHLLDNDFFGQSEWRARLDEIRRGGFKVCLNQGINVRLITDEAAEALASIQYYDDAFRKRRLYTAWDNLKDERVFVAGVERLVRAGILTSHLLVYMLVGWDPKETWERLFYRFNRMLEAGVMPYPMVYGDRSKQLPLGGHNQRIANKTVGDFQRWVIGRYYKVTPFADYDSRIRGAVNVPDQLGLFPQPA